MIIPIFFKWFVTLYPPLFFFAGVRVKEVSPDFRRIVVVTKLSWYNRNYVGTQFGGTLYAMADPFYMIMLMKNLGKDYIVWDKAAYIEFVKPGKGTVKAVFELTQERIDEIIEKTKGGSKYLPEFWVDVVDEKGEVVAKVKKVLYVRRRQQS
ncbi:conserved hypothetical protein [Thermosulfidibacter takaii ABI70S6]|uniref:DUF4442 domain-containing protein n=1 Tax=Thermosulfidibacter takaii (strain DSM 17441 / JCM 13301 / NBRC 103674 / ABI70S6) TaxID=1298851 RepID=A0A0S3QUR9_THET7|nr:DUF4442 domain-containing protein [Thermosulfidibacter takaii]BAT72084.1 conserved hypothetical protein [Thermosulfidibacter takaii ABI70S6]